MLPRILLIALTAAVALPASASAATTVGVNDGTLTITGDAAADQLTLSGTRGTLQVTAGAQQFAVSRSRFNVVIVRSGAGADDVRVDESAAVDGLRIETGPGADVVRGSSRVEVIDSGEDADLVSPGAGNDTVVLGAGDDSAVQTAGDDVDRIDGQTGLDTLRVLGTSESEEFTLQALGGRARISRDTSPALAEVSAVEIADVSAAGGGDLVDIGNLAGSGLQRVDADLGAADGARDQVAAQGSAANDFIGAGVNVDSAVVSGLGGGLFVRIDNARAADDLLTLFGGDGRDSITANSLAGVIGVALDGGAGSDTLTGGDAADRLRGGAGIDLVIGRKGDDSIDLGEGDDGALYNDGDGNDTVEGSTGSDTLSVRGSNVAETVGVAANGSRVRVSRGAVALDVGGVERLDVDLLGGADRLGVGDLAGTGLTSIDADVGTGDNATDEVTVSGTPGKDTITVAGATVTGLAAQVRIEPAESRDKLTLNGLDGADSIDTKAVPASGIRIQADGGLGDDVVLGGPGDDVSLGGDGADVLFAGKGDNVALGGRGDDVLRGEEGDDVLDGGADEDVLIGNAGDDVLLNGEVVFDE